MRETGMSNRRDLFYFNSLNKSEALKSNFYGLADLSTHCAFYDIIIVKIIDKIKLLEHF